MAADSEFVLDAVIGFLTSPVWSIPVLTFMEEKCLVFDPDGKNYEAYDELHRLYKETVETLLSSFVKDVGISPEQFTEACRDAPDNPIFTKVPRQIFEQIWAADDYEIFKRMMIQKNIEIQLQALKLIEQHGKSSLREGSASPQMSSAPMLDEDAIMQEVLRRSKEEYEAQSKDKSADQELENAFEESKKENDSKTLTLALEEAEDALEFRLLLIAKREQEEMEKALKESIRAHKEQRKAEKATAKETQATTPLAPISSPSSTPAPKGAVSKPGEVAGAKVLSPVKPPIHGGAPPATAEKTAATATPSDAAASWLSSAKAEAGSTTATATVGQGTQMSEEELKRRTEYLRQQRDKLLALKKQERVKHLAKFTEEQPKARPASARAARRVTVGDRSEPASPDGGDNGKKLEMRRALADVLKREVIEKQ